VHDLAELRWLFGSAYLAIALLAWRSSEGVSAGERRSWLAIAVVLLLFGLGKVFNLEEYLLDRIRFVAQRQHWYDWHKSIQLVWLLVLASITVACFLTLPSRLRSNSVNGRVAIIATGQLAASIAVRCASIHVVDEWVIFPIAGLRLGWWIEAMALIVIGVAAGTSRVRTRAEPTAR
jgi:hypothetical protein